MLEALVIILGTIFFVNIPLTGWLFVSALVIWLLLVEATIIAAGKE